jgi:hypothetical protein
MLRHHSPGLRVLVDVAAAQGNTAVAAAYRKQYAQDVERMKASRAREP